MNLLPTRALFGAVAVLIAFLPHQSKGTEPTHATNTPRQLSGSLVPLGDVVNYQISPASNYAVYVASQDNRDVEELFSVPIDGGAAVKLNPLLVNQIVSNYVFSPDGTRVIFLLRNVDTGQTQLYAIDTNGANRELLIESLDAAGNLKIREYKVSPDYSRIVFDARPNGGSQDVLFSMDTSGRNLTQLSGLRSEGDDLQLFDYSINPNSSTVAYRAFKSGVFDDLKLFSAPITGGSAIKLDSTPQDPGVVFNFGFSPDGARIVYVASNPDDTNLVDIYSVPSAGGLSILLGGESIFGQLGSAGTGFRISPDNNHVVYAYYFRSNGKGNLYSVPLAGGTPVRLNDPNDHSIGDVSGNIAISHDSRFVIYSAEQDGPLRQFLYSASIGVGDPVKISATLPQGRRIGRFKLSPNSKHILFSADTIFQGVFELIYASLEGNAQQIVNPLSFIFTGAASLREFDFTPDSANVIYQASTQSPDSRLQLFFLPTANNEPDNVKQVNSELPFGGDVKNYQISPDGRYIVYLADQDIAGDFELFAAEIQGLNNEICLPIKTKNSNIAIVCL